MSHTIHLKPLGVEPLARLRDVLALLVAMHGLREPLTSEAGLRAALKILAQAAELMAIDPGWIERVRLVLANEHAFRIVLSIVQYMASLIGEEDEPSARAMQFQNLSIDAQALSLWLPFVLDLIALWQFVRGV